SCRLSTYIPNPPLAPEESRLNRESSLFLSFKALKHGNSCPKSKREHPFDGAHRPSRTPCHASLIRSINRNRSLISNSQFRIPKNSICKSSRLLLYLLKVILGSQKYRVRPMEIIEPCDEQSVGSR